MQARGILLDLEGVLYQGDDALPGTADAAKALSGSGFEIRYLTNTTTQPRKTIADRLADMGFELEAEHIFTPPLAATRLLKRDHVERIHLATAPGLAVDLSGFELVDDHPEAVVLGDLYLDFTWHRLNEIFQMLQQGARLVALHKNRYCRRGQGIALDLGPLVAALEYASGITAEIVGKPSPTFFNLALDDLGLTASDVVMVGDDLEADIGGAKAVGMQTIQVETGKYRPSDLHHPSIQPDRRIASAMELPQILISDVCKPK
ncbi:MAG: TIGR01458 family HAD-type hydrolase [Geminicoccales bacterium]